MAITPAKGPAGRFSRARPAAVALGLSALGVACALAPAVWAQEATLSQGRLEVETREYRAVVDETGTGLSHFFVKGERYTRDGEQIDVVTTDKQRFLPLRQRITGAGEQEAPDRWQAERTVGGLVLRARLGDLALSRKLEPGEGPFQLWSTLQVKNTGSESLELQLVEEGHHYVPRELESGGLIGGRSPFQSGATCVGEDGAEREEREDIVEATVEGEPLTFAGEVPLGAVGNVYFTQAMAAHEAKYTRCVMTGSDRGGTPDSPHGSLLNVRLTRETVALAPGESHVFQTLHFLGPKMPDLLAEAGHGLTAVNRVAGIPGINAIAGGLATLLSIIHDKVGNWGLAIILLTFVVKLVLYPLTAKSFESMAAMRKLKPEIDALNEKYADDREKKGAAMMELYKKHRINPLAGCLPQLLQMPIWIALYTSLSTNVELFRQPFVWFWQDLTSPDPYYVLPLGLGVLMYLQQRLTPTTMDAAQAKMMMYLMPGMITAFMLFLPSGLCLYMFTNSVLTIGQQRVIEYRLNKKDGGSTPATEEASAPAEPADSAKQRRRRGRA